MTLDQLKAILRNQQCSVLYVKSLSENDNTKNQIYLAGDFSALNKFPIGDIERDSSSQAGSVRDRFKANTEFYWVNADGTIEKAEGANLIFYPRYPEVRLSGLLRGVSSAARNTLLAQRCRGRVLFLATSTERKIYAWIDSADSPIAQDVNQLILQQAIKPDGVFYAIPLTTESTTDEDRILFSRLRKIHDSGWIRSKRLDSNGNILPCRAPNCGGYTLEAELGVRPNGKAEPDFMGWEIKQFASLNFEKPSGNQITLMTPEPDGGYYKSHGVEAFVRKFGYPDRKGRPDRLNFGGVHYCGRLNSLTNLTLHINGYDSKSGKILDTSGSVNLLTESDDIAASWSFSGLLKHWNKKHAKAVFVPSQARRDPHLAYRFGNKVFTGRGADFTLVLTALNNGWVVYDPGIKLENASSSSPKTKQRSQFRVKVATLSALYQQAEWMELA